MHDDLVADLPAGDARADLPYDPRRVGAADVVADSGWSPYFITDTGLPRAAQTLL